MALGVEALRAFLFPPAAKRLFPPVHGQRGNSSAGCPHVKDLKLNKLKSANGQKAQHLCDLSLMAGA